jgi:hypothetical protein
MKKQLIAALLLCGSFFADGQAAGLFAPDRDAARQLAAQAEQEAAAGQTGLAVLHYERALLLAPWDSSLRAELLQLRRDTKLEQEKPWHERLAERFSGDQWLLFASAAFVLLALTALAAGLLGRRRFPQACRLSAFFVAATLLPLPPAWLRYQAEQDGIVTAADARLLLSPFAKAEVVAPLKEGSRVRPLGKTHGQHELVRDENGRSGWLERGSFQRIAARP